MNTERSHSISPEALAGLGGGRIAYIRPIRSEDVNTLFPQAPQLILSPLDDPEWKTFYVIKHGISRTGMPAWGRTMKDEDLWKVTALLSRLTKLPPAVQEQWKNGRERVFGEQLLPA